MTRAEFKAMAIGMGLNPPKALLDKMEAAGVLTKL